MQTANGLPLIMAILLTMPMPKPVPNFLESHIHPLMIMYGLPAFLMEVGTSYEFSFWWAGDGYAGWTGDVVMNTFRILPEQFKLEIHL